MIFVVLPFRLASSRIDKKILADIEGQPLAVRTAGRVLEAFAGEKDLRILAAVDDGEVAAILRKAHPHLEIIQTDPQIPSGTDRVFAAIQKVLEKEPTLKAKVSGILNVQGDMPFVGKQGLRQAAGFLKEKALNKSQEKQAFWVTLSETWPEGQDFDDLGAVKVLSDQKGRALYFSRYPIPHSRVKAQASKNIIPELHIGVYGFTLDALTTFCSHAPVEIEKAESLEQLRALWLGIPIHVLHVEFEKGASYRGIDMPADLQWAINWAKNNS